MLNTKLKQQTENRMTNSAKQILEQYKTARTNRNNCPYEVGCSNYESFQADLDYWYKKLCAAERNQEVTKNEIMTSILVK